MQPVRILPAFLFITLAHSVKSLRGLALRFVVAVFQTPGHGSCVLPFFVPVFTIHRKTEAAIFFRKVARFRSDYIGSHPVRPPR
jgi:hypothetical protein